MKLRVRVIAPLLVLLPALVRSDPTARVAEGPLADAVRRGLASGQGRFDHEPWDALLRRHVDTKGGVDYASLARERAALEAYLAALARADLATLRGPELLALLVNAYNACTVRLILDGSREGRLPASIRDIPDPWGQTTCAVGGQAVSLDTIEHGILRPIFKDTRIHAAVNCASRSCPALAPWAFRGDRIDDQLRERMQTMVGSPAHANVVGGVLFVSKIFDWYGSDFTDPSLEGSAGSVAEYVVRFAPPDLRRRIDALGPRPRVDFLGYDWSLNGR